MDRYLKESARTVADQAFFENESSLTVDDCLIGFIERATELDALKKSIFYGKNFDAEGPYHGDEIDYSLRAKRDVIHGILGIATESAEIAELLLADKVDTAKLLDEAGDILWYLALIFRTLGVTFEQVGDLNLAKLKARFPGKFEAKKAIQRTTDKEEQAVFEGF